MVANAQLSTPVTVRVIYEIIEDTKYKVKDVLTALNFPKSTYMYWKNRLHDKDKDLAIMEAIKKIRQENENYGYRRVHQALKAKGFTVNKKKVQRIMKKMGLQVTCFKNKSGKFSTYKGTVGKIAPHRIKRRFHTSIVHQKITTDTSEFKYYYRDGNNQKHIGKLYLNPFMDMFNSEIISYSISRRATKQAVMEAQKKAIEITNDCLYRRTFHSDQGSHYQTPEYGGLLKANHIFQSMSRKGTCLDNAIMENFFGIMKQEMYYRRIFDSYEELKEAIEKYIEYYNTTRIKAKLGYLSPVEYRIRYGKTKAVS